MQVDFRMAMIAILLILLGCLGKTISPAGDSAHAKYILVSSLEAWKEGRVKSLSTRSPEIRFEDDDQRAGMELIDYEFENEAVPVLPFQSVGIILTLRNREGQTVEKTALYQVGVHPKLTVLRSDN